MVVCSRDVVHPFLTTPASEPRVHHISSVRPFEECDSCMHNSPALAPEPCRAARCTLTDRWSKAFGAFVYNARLESYLVSSAKDQVLLRQLAVEVRVCVECPWRSVTMRKGLGRELRGSCRERAVSNGHT